MRTSAFPLLLLLLWTQIPETAQTFTLTLSSPTGGARLGSPVSVALTVPANDAPIRFTTASVTAAEGTSAILSLTRGTDAQGQSLGDISGAATVGYRTISGNSSSNF